MSLNIIRGSSIVVLMLSFAGGAFAQAAQPDTQTGGLEQQVRSAQQQMLQVGIQGDKDAFSRFIADDVAWVAIDGHVMNKDQTLADAVPAPVRSLEVQQILPSGQTATVVGLVHMGDGTERRVLQQWINRDGRWQVLAHESTLVTPEAASASGTMATSPTGTSGMSPTAAATVAPALNSDQERSVWQAQTEIVDAYSKGDVARYSRLTANPFARVETDGQLYDRREWLERVAKNAEHPLRDGAVSDVQIKLDDANTLARVTMQVVPFNPDGTQGSPERQTRIFSMRDGRWQQVAAISTKLSSER